MKEFSGAKVAMQLGTENTQNPELESHKPNWKNSSSTFWRIIKAAMIINSWQITVLTTHGLKTNKLQTSNATWTGEHDLKNRNLHETQKRGYK